MDEDSVLLSVIERMGEEKQLRQTQEELAECIVAISHYLRNSGIKEVDQLLEELAHVDIMAKQCKIIMARLHGQSVGTRVLGYRAAALYRIKKIIQCGS
jgi:hypothetical protein